MSLTINTAPVGVQQSTSITGTLEISGPSMTNYGLTHAPIMISMSPGTQIATYLPNEVPESWLMMHFMAASIQGLRSSGQYKTSEDIAAQAHHDACAAIEAIKRVKAVTNALADSAQFAQQEMVR